MYAYTLVIIDMQECFDVDTNSKLVDNVIREIDEAKRNKKSVILVKYAGCGPSLSKITKRLSKYNKLIKVTKRINDGSIEICKSIADKSKVCKDYFKVCGVNTNACVLQTVTGLTNKFPNATVEVIADACDDSNYKDAHIRGLRNMRKKRNVVIRSPLL